MHEMLLSFTKAWLMGIAVAAPVGPIGVLCIKKTIEFGLCGALSVGLGASLADTIYGIIAAAGLTVVSGLLMQHAALIKIGGGLFLLSLGIKEIMQHGPIKTEVAPDASTFFKLGLKTFALTLTNPMTILLFLGIFATLGADDGILIQEAIMLIAGIFCGSMTWWLILGKMVTTTRHYLPPNIIHKTTLFSATILIGFGVWAFGSGLFEYLR